jgi:hypothetical protein
MTMSRYAYDYSLTPARPTGWRATLTNITVVGTVIAVSTISGALVTLQLFASPAPAMVAPQVVAAIPVQPAPQTIATRVVASAARDASAPVAAASNQAEPPTTVAAAAQVPPSPPVTRPAQPAPVVAVAQPAPAPIADSELTFAKGYAQRRGAENGAVARHGKVIVAAKAELGRAAVKAKPKVYARNNANSTNGQDRRGVQTARSDAFSMFQRFDRPDQSDVAHHQALAFGEQRTPPPRRRSDAPARPAAPYGNSPNGLFGGLF